MEIYLVLIAHVYMLVLSTCCLFELALQAATNNSFGLFRPHQHGITNEQAQFPT